MKKGNGEQQLSKWTQQLYDKLAEHETAAPADLWSDIEAALPQQPRRARFVALRRWAVAASVALLLGGGALLWRSAGEQQSESLISMTEELQDNMLQEEDLSDDMLQDEASSDTMLPDEPPRGVAVPMPSREKATGRGARLGKGGRGVASGSSTTLAQAEMPAKEEKLQTSPTISEGMEEPSSGEVRVAQPSIEEAHAAQLPFEEPVTSPRTHHASHRPALSLYAMNGLSSQDNSNAVRMADALAKNYANTIDASQPASRQPPVWLAGFEERKHHRQPVAFGLTLSYPVNGRLAVVSGLVYTRLKSDFTQTVRSQHIFKDQTLHYVGIPLSASYRLWQYKGLKTYLSAGMQADWNVKAQLKTEGVQQEMNLDQLQWSVSGSLGLQYDVLPQLSLYAEPGINHYFDNGSMVQNFFKDKPTSLKLQLGIRMNLQ